ncbi:hypothetical protein Hanom_Chr14g01298241 [Helianthus anomalus]
MKKKHPHTKECKLLYLEGVTFLWNAPFHYHMINKHVSFHSIRMIHSFHLLFLHTKRYLRLLRRHYV